MSELAIVYDDSLSNYDFGSRHPLKPQRLKLTYELLKTIGYLERSNVSIFEPKMAEDEEISLFHTKDYIEQVKRYSKEGTGFLDSGDTPAFEGCYEATCIVVGASLKSLELVMNDKVEHAFNMSGGLHHARQNRASGFCIFNDPAICIALLKKEFDIDKIFYLDIDAHHGDGVMYGFYSDPSLLDIDFHEDGNYLFPGTGFIHELGSGEGKGLKINCPFSPNASDVQYLKAFKELVPHFVEKYRPNVILMQCGADSHYGDLLTHLDLTTLAYSKIANTIHDIAHRYCEGRLVLFGGGGYNLFNVSRCWAVILSEIIGQKSDVELPHEWKALYKRLVGTPIPSNLYDFEITKNNLEDDEKNSDEILRNINYIKTNAI